jgi:hypothetical protein
MFKQEIHNQGTPSQNQPDEPLFDNYEMRSWKFSTQVYQIFAVSLLFNVIAIFGLGQSNLLTVKGCDSPLIGGVCDVLDTVYVGSKLFGTEGGYVDEDYTKTELADADITYINLTGQDPPLYYPSNYFEIANANDPKDPEFVPGISDGPIAPTNPTFPSMAPPLETRPQVTPTPNNNVVQGVLPGENDVNDNDPTPPFQNIRPGKGPKGLSRDHVAGANTPPNPTPTPVTPESLAEIRPNKRPGYELAYGILDGQADPAKKLDLSKNFTIEMNGVLTDEGKLNPKLSGVVRVEGDENMKALAKKALETIDEMGMFVYLKKLEVNHINFVLVQDDTQLYAVITSDQKTKSKAGSVANGLKNAIEFAKLLNSKDDDTIELLKAATVTQKDKSFTINFALPKDVAQALIQRQLAKAAERRKQEEEEKKKAGGAAVTQPGNLAAVK